MHPLPEPSDTPVEERKPCRYCGSINRNYEMTLFGTVSVESPIDPVGRPIVELAPREREALEVRRAVENAGFDLTWLQLSDGGAWMIRVYDRDGAFVDGSIADDPQEALLAVAERLLPKT